VKFNTAACFTIERSNDYISFPFDASLYQPFINRILQSAFFFASRDRVPPRDGFPASPAKKSPGILGRVARYLSIFTNRERAGTGVASINITLYQ